MNEEGGRRTRRTTKRTRRSRRSRDKRRRTMTRSRSKVAQRIRGKGEKQSGWMG